MMSKYHPKTVDCLAYDNNGKTNAKQVATINIKIFKMYISNLQRPIVIAVIHI